MKAILLFLVIFCNTSLKIALTDQFVVKLMKLSHLWPKKGLVSETTGS